MSGKRRPLRVGIYGNSIKGFIEKAVHAVDNSDEIDIVDITFEPSGFKHKKSFLEKARIVINEIGSIMKIDVLCMVYIDRRSYIFAKVAHLFRKKVIYYWLGSDVFSLINGELSEKAAAGKRVVDLHLAYSEGLIKELSGYSIDAQLLITPSYLPPTLSRMPDRHAVLLSIPDNRKEFYGYADLIRLIQDYPNISFYIVRGTDEHLYPFKNVIFLGRQSYEQMQRVFDKISIVVRFPIHDGTSLILMESAFKGKYIISKNYFPNAIIAETYEQLRKALDSTLQLPLKPQVSMHEYARNHFTQEQAGEQWIMCFRKLLSE